MYELVKGKLSLKIYSLEDAMLYKKNGWKLMKTPKKDNNEQSLSNYKKHRADATKSKKL